jgi:hypothetical protein
MSEMHEPKQKARPLYYPVDAVPAYHSNLREEDLETDMV